MSRGSRRAGALLVGLLLVLTACSGSDELAVIAGDAPTPSPSPIPRPTCPLSGLEPQKRAHLRRPAVAIKVVNVPAAYPLTGLEDAELVFEEVVEGGTTRFMAIYHCADPERVGPIRSVRAIDVAILAPITRIMAASGGNPTVLGIIRNSGIFLVEEMPAWANAVMRVPRTGVSREHTLYAVPAAVREIGDPERAHRPPAKNFFTFGELDDQSLGQRARSITLTFGRLTTVNYEWNGEAWERYQGGAQFLDADGDPLEIDNLIIEERRVNNSRIFRDVAGNPSPEIANETGSGRAMLFRDGRAIRGRWIRDEVDKPTRYVRQGEPLPLKPGRTWIALFPGPNGEVQGEYSFQRRRNQRD